MNHNVQEALLDMTIHDNVFYKRPPSAPPPLETVVVPRLQRLKGWEAGALQFRKGITKEGMTGVCKIMHEVEIIGRVFSLSQITRS